jgi:hypothetical protein
MADKALEVWVDDFLQPFDGLSPTDFKAVILIAQSAHCTLSH